MVLTSKQKKNKVRIPPSVSHIKPNTVILGLQERREKKKARRDIMKPETLKKKQAETDLLQLKKKKKKQNMPSGLALMYGFTASNVGQKRLTVCSCNGET
jgi:hypothetical protein